jgi:hypothetical protein
MDSKLWYKKLKKFLLGLGYAKSEVGLISCMGRMYTNNYYT